MTSRLSLFLLSLLVGCASAHGPLPPPTRASEPAPELASSLAPAGPVAEARAEPAPLAPAPKEDVAPARRATRWVLLQEWWRTDAPRVLRTPSGLVFATMTEATYLRLATKGGTVAEAWIHGLLLFTTPQAGDLPLFARDDLVFAGVLHAGRATALDWTPSDDERMRATPPVDPRVRFVNSPSLEVAHEELVLMPGATEPTLLDHSLRGRGPIAVTLEAGGPAVVMLRSRRAIDVTLLERSGPYAKIAWPIADRALKGATVVGWVDGDLVKPRSSAVSVRSVETPDLDGEVSMDWGGCLEEHPLFVEAGNGPEPIGTILPGTRVRPGPRRGDLIAVELVGPSARHIPASLQLRRGAQLLLDPDAATDCAR